MDAEALDMLMVRNNPVVPALQFEWASVEFGKEFGLSQKVIDGHKETLEGGAESARMILRAGGRLGLDDAALDHRDEARAVLQQADVRRHVAVDD